MVLRTFSKTWAMAGLRLGYAVADPSVVAAMSNVALPYHLDALKQAAGRLALRFEDEMRSRVASTVEERGRLVTALARDEGRGMALGGEFRPLPRHHAATAREVWNELLEHSVLVRDVSDWPGLEGCLRVTVGTRL